MHVVEEVSAQDLPAVIRIANAALTEQYAEEFFLAMLETAPEAFLVARPVLRGPGRVEGFALAVRSTPVEARVLTIAVAPSAQGRGLGRRLLVEAERRLVRAGSLEVSLEVREDNLRALRFYRRLGYEIVRSIPTYYADGARAVVMRKGL